jgi:hypothetical protein
MLYTRLGRSSLEVCYIYPCCDVCAIYPCCTPRHLPSCAMPSRWDCQPALKLSSKCGCSCSPQLIPPIGATLSEWTVLSHLIETDLPFATLMLTHNGTQCPYICRHPKMLHRLSFAMPVMPAVTVLRVASSWPSVVIIAWPSSWSPLSSSILLVTLIILAILNLIPSRGTGGGGGRHSEWVTVYPTPWVTVYPTV